MKPHSRARTDPLPAVVPEYGAVWSGVVELLESARRTSARTVNAIMTAVYWEIGRRIVESEQRGVERAGYGEGLVQRLAADLTARFGRGFGYVNLTQMRRFYLAWPAEAFLQTPSEESTGEKARRATSQMAPTTPAQSAGASCFQTPSGKSALALPVLAHRFPLPWSHYTRDRLPDQVLAAEYKMALPDEQTLAAELERTQAALERRAAAHGRAPAQTEPRLRAQRGRPRTKVWRVPAAPSALSRPAAAPGRERADPPGSRTPGFPAIGGLGAASRVRGEGA